MIITYIYYHIVAVVHLHIVAAADQSRVDFDNSQEDEVRLALK